MVEKKNIVNDGVINQLSYLIDGNNLAIYNVWGHHVTTLHEIKNNYSGPRFMAKCLGRWWRFVNQIRATV